MIKESMGRSAWHVIAVLAACLTFAPASDAVAQITVGGDLHKHSRVGPGESYEESIQIQNSSDSAATVILTKRDFTHSYSDGPSYLDPGTIERSNADWILGEESFRVRVPARSTEEVTFTVEVPGEGAPDEGAFDEGASDPASPSSSEDPSTESTPTESIPTESVSTEEASREEVSREEASTESASSEGASASRGSVQRASSNATSSLSSPLGSYWSVVMVRRANPPTSTTEQGFSVRQIKRYAVLLVTTVNQGQTQSEMRILSAEVQPPDSAAAGGTSSENASSENASSENAPSDSTSSDSSPSTSNSPTSLSIAVENAGQEMDRVTAAIEMYDKETGSLVKSQESPVDRLYPQTSRSFEFDLSGVGGGTYQTLIVIDADNGSSIAREFDLTL